MDEMMPQSEHTRFYEDKPERLSRIRGRVITAESSKITEIRGNESNQLQGEEVEEYEPSKLQWLKSDMRMQQMIGS